MSEFADRNEHDENADGEAGDGLLDRLRDSPVGVNDPTIVGDVGPTDVPPGSDGDELVLEPHDGGGGDPGPDDL